MTGIGVAAALAATSCGTPTSAPLVAKPTVKPPSMSNCTPSLVFELLLASDHGGQSTPELSAAWFARHGGVPNIPANGWRQSSETDSVAKLYSGATTLSALKGSDGTWQIDAGTRCP